MKKMAHTETMEAIVGDSSKRKALNSDSTVANKIIKLDESLGMDRTLEKSTIKIITQQVTNVMKTHKIQEDNNKLIAMDTYVTNHTIDINQASYLLDIAYSKDYAVIIQISEAFKKIAQRKIDALKVIEETAKVLCCEHLLKFIFDGKEEKYCEFFIGDTLISSGSGKNKLSSQLAAVDNCFNVFNDVYGLPYKTTENLISKFVEFQRDKSNVNLLINSVKNQSTFTVCVHKTRELILSDFSSMLAFAHFAERLSSNCVPEMQILMPFHHRQKFHIQYFFHADWKCRQSPSHIFCHLVINNVLIASGHGSSKKVSKLKAVLGFKYLFDLLKHAKHKDLLTEQQMPNNSKKRKKNRKRREKLTANQNSQIDNESIIVDKKFEAKFDGHNQPIADVMPEASTCRFIKEEPINNVELSKTENTQKAVDSYVTNHTIDVYQAFYLLDIAFSENCNLILEIANSFRNISSPEKIKRQMALNVIEETAKSLSCEHLLQFRFEGEEKKYCEFFIGNTLISSGCGKDELESKLDSIYNCFNVFKDVYGLPFKTAENFVSEFIKFQRNDGNAKLLMKFVKNIPYSKAWECKTRTFTLSDFCLFFAFSKFAAQLLSEGASEGLVLSVSHANKKLIYFHYFFHSDRKNKQPPSYHFCHLVINNVLVSSGCGTSKNQSKLNANNGFKYLLDILKHVKQKELLMVQPLSKNVRKKLLNSREYRVKIQDDKIHSEFLEVKINKVQNKVDTLSKLATELITSCNADMFDKDRLKMTYEMNFALFRSSKATQGADLTSAQEILDYSASQSQAKINYKVEVKASVNPGESVSWRCSVYINKMLISSGEALIKKKAKLIAADSALEILKRTVYTIQKKDHVNIITRQQVEHHKAFFQGIFSNNNGHPILLKMDLSGGAINNSGNTEPIDIKPLDVDQDLGYISMDNEIQPFYKKIKSFLWHYGRSDVISDLEFSTEFSKEEMMMIKRAAFNNKLLRVHKYGTEELNRNLRVKRKWSLRALLKWLVVKNGVSENYELVTVL